MVIYAVFREEFFAANYAHLSVKFSRLKVCECKQNDKYQVCKDQIETQLGIDRRSDMSAFLLRPYFLFPRILDQTLILSGIGDDAVQTHPSRGRKWSIAQLT